MSELTLGQLLVATRNLGKFAEIQAVLGDLPLRLRTLTEFPRVESVEEVGATYEENAVLKAAYYARQTGLWTVADDSGLEVAALGGAPGVFSARYAGIGASDSQRLSFLLERLADIGDEERWARFVCVMGIANPSATVVKVSSGTCEGRLARAPRGTHGFGYDPIFIADGYDATFAELSVGAKNVVSHRAKALLATRDFLARTLVPNLTARLPPS